MIQVYKHQFTLLVNWIKHSVGAQTSVGLPHKNDEFWTFVFEQRSKQRNKKNKKENRRRRLESATEPTAPHSTRHYKKKVDGTAILLSYIRGREVPVGPESL